MLKVSEFEKVLDILPEKIRLCFENLPADILGSVTEIRVRKDKPVMFYGGFGAVFAINSGSFSSLFSQRCLFADKEDIEQIIARASGYSLYSHFDELANGFITLNGGHRIGIGATAVKNGESFRDIESLNIRLARSHRRCADFICSEIFKDGLCSFLIAGPPGSGKTTILRDIAVTLSENPKYGYPRITLADERFELSECVSAGDFRCCDIIKGYTKERAFETALRSLCPDIIISDELSFKDALITEKMLDCGVFAGVSVHASNIEDLYEKEGIGHLVKGGKFKKTVILEGKNTPGKVKEII